MSSTMEARYYPHKRAHSSIALPQEDDAREEECPSPPPFFRVSGMFTVFNPSRPMAEAKRKEQQALAVDIQSDDSDSTKQAMSMLDLPDLVGDNNNQHATCAAMQDDWSNSLEGMRDLSVDSSSNQHETQTAMDMLPMTPTAKTQASEALLKLSSLPVIPTPQGLALLLKTNHDTVSTNHRNGVSTTNTTTSLVDPPPLRRHARWTSEEDEVLRDAVAKEEGPPHNWKRISKKYFHGSRNAMACKGRWNKNLQPGLVHAKWTAQEDNVVLQGHNDGLSWPQIADKLVGRPPEQVRNRFLNDIDPTLNRKPFTQAEKRKVYELQAQYGNKWTQIASEMPGRSEKMVKNCWFNAKMSHRRMLRRAAKQQSSVATASDDSSSASLTMANNQS